MRFPEFVSVPGPLIVVDTNVNPVWELLRSVVRLMVVDDRLKVPAPLNDPPRSTVPPLIANVLPAPIEMDPDVVKLGVVAD